ncbi:hypothetical protein DRN72_00370 [Methanosarcinales archaeon]|nr:MAG: hypothetical protein DRN72_00370 [Methanosarcinales archaeon]
MLQTVRQMDVASIEIPDWKCVGCGECCVGEENFVRVFYTEAKRLSEVMGVDVHDIIEPNPQTISGVHLGWILRREDNKCIFFDGGRGRCRIYQNRPIVCRTYPFMLDFEEGRIALRVFECRGLGNRNSTSPHSLKRLLK